MPKGFTGTATKGGKGKFGSFEEILKDEVLHEAMQNEAAKNGWSVEEEHDWQHSLAQEHSETHGVDAREAYEQQIAALKAQQEQMQQALQQNIQHTNEHFQAEDTHYQDTETTSNQPSPEIKKEEVEEVQDTETTSNQPSPEIKKEEVEEVNRVKEQVSQRDESNREKEIQDANDMFETKKQELKQKYEDKVREIQEGPPGYLKFFTGSWIFWGLMILDSVFSLIPYLGTFLQIIPTILGIIIYAIPLLLVGNIGGLIFVVIFYLIDLALSAAFSLIGTFLPAIGDLIDVGLDTLPEIIASRMGFAGYQIVERSVEKFQEKRLRRAEEKFKEGLVNLDERHRKKIKKINAKYDGKKLALFSKFSVDIDVNMQKVFSGLILIIAAVLTWFGVLGVDMNNFSLMPLIITGIFIIIMFFFQKMGLMPAE